MLATNLVIRPLEWREWSSGRFQADCIFGTYHTWRGHFRRPGELAGTPANDPEDAAQADFEARIRSALVDPSSVGSVDSTQGPFEARSCKGIPSDCCDYGVVSLSAGQEVCRVWKEDDARSIADLLNGRSSTKSSLRPLVLTDLDDTIFRNVTKIPADERERSIDVVMDTGNRLSVMTPRQASFFEWLRSTCDVVPVTARSLEAFLKIHLSFGDGWKIAGNGAVVINPCGNVDSEWADMISSELSTYAVILQEMYEEALDLVQLKKLEVTVKRYAEYGREHCVLFSCETPSRGHLDGIAALLRLNGADIHIHHNDSVLALTAGPVSKKRAAKYVLSKIEGLENRPILAFGDSLTDLPFMSLGDFICAPSKSQISESVLQQIL
jgi:hypothetical protein